MNEQKLIDLEIQFSHQEREIEVLQKTVSLQQLAFDKLEKRVKILSEQLQGSVGSGQEIGPGNEKPPHY